MGVRMTVTPQELTERMRVVWSAGDYNPIATREVLVSELLAREIDVHWGDRVLDVAAGTGNTALAAARRGARVTASDFSATMLERAAQRAAVEGLEIEIEVADAQRLPFPDDMFDVVLSTFGVMYAPDQQRTADELIRVTTPGGRIGLVSWTPDGLVGRLQGSRTEEVPGQPPPPGKTASLWGTEQHCKELFGDRISELRSTLRTQEFCAASARAQVDFLLEHLPPARAGHGMLDADGQRRWIAAGLEEFERHNRAQDG